MADNLNNMEQQQQQEQVSQQRLYTKIHYEKFL